MGFAPFFTTKNTVERKPGPFSPKTQSFAGRLETIERMFSMLENLQLPQDQVMQLARDARARNAYGTASIEGNPMTLEEVRSLMEKAPQPSRDLVTTEMEILQWVAYMESDHAIESAADVLQMHQDLLHGIINNAGEFKQQVNFIADGKREIHFIAAGPERTIPDLEQLFAWFRSTPIHPILKIGLFFHQFQSIHPFGDGNGRVGRAIATLQLQQAGYNMQFVPLDYAFNAHQMEYYDAIQKTRVKDNHDIWLGFWLNMLEVSLHMGVQRATLNQELPNLPAEAIRLAEWAGRLALGSRGAFAFADAAAAFPHLTERTLRRHLSRLVQENILARHGAGRGSRYQLHDQIRTRRLE